MEIESWIDWSEAGAKALPAEALRALRYMQDIESHTIVYLRSLLGTRAVDDPAIADFLARWFHEETLHGQALARLLAAQGEPIAPRARSALGVRERIHGAGAALLSRVWPEFPVVHMLWGAINELTTLTGYRRLVRRADHPGLTALLTRIMHDVSRHFGFYSEEARKRLAAPGVARRARALVERLWAPVGTGVQPDAEVRFVARYLFAGADGLAAARRVDDTIGRLPGLAGVPLLEAWLAADARRSAKQSPIAAG
jgi:hypothetical protein